MPTDLHLQTPASWADLNQRQLRRVLNILARHGLGQKSQTHIMLLLTGLQPRRRAIGGQSYATADGQRIVLTNDKAAALTDHFQWTQHPEQCAARLEHLAYNRRLRPLPLLFHGVPFSRWLAVESAYRTTLDNPCTDTAARLIQRLYLREDGTPARRPPIATPAEQLGAMQWMAYLHAQFAKHFAYLFRPAEDSRHTTFLDTANTLTRALTDGDITRETVVMQTDVWRALTELDAKAKEASQAQKQTK